MSNLTLITGGARSGKTSYALGRALSHSAPRLYIATAEAADDEMKERIENHRREREGLDFVTNEITADLFFALENAHENGYECAVLDCLTLWLTNVMLDPSFDTDKMCSGLVDSLKKSRIPVYAVTNEIGLGVVPGNELSRRFRDTMGKLNHTVAESAQNVYLMISGIPVKIK